MPTSKQATADTRSAAPPIDAQPDLLAAEALTLEPEPSATVQAIARGEEPRLSFREELTLLQLRMQEAAQERAGRFEQRPDLFQVAFARAQAQFGPILRDTTVKVWSQRTQKEYTFKFAPLPNILAATIPALTSEGFSVWQEVIRDREGPTGWAVLTHLEHAHGTRTNSMPVFVGDATSAAFAGACSYARRYGYTLMMNVAADDDEDGNFSRGDHYETGPSAGGARTGQRGKDPAPPPGGAPGRATTAGTRAPPAQKAPQPERIPSYLETIDTVDVAEAPESEEALAKADARVVDASQELIEAAQDGRAHGIEQIWNEIRTDQYVAIQTWRRVKAEAPDAFRTVKAVLEKAEKAAQANRPAVKRGDRG